MDFRTLTPLLTVDDVDACLPFWTERLGFEVLATVPHGDATGFAMLRGGGVELMYQSRASVAADLGEAAGAAGRAALPDRLAEAQSALFLRVGDLDAVIDALADIDPVVPRRTTFYGMDEIWVEAPCGTLVGFAAPAAAEGSGEGAA